MTTLPTPSDVSITAGGPELLGDVAPLWSALRRHHAELSATWSASILASSFEARAKHLETKSAAGGLLVLLAAIDGQAVGYCVSTVTQDGAGEVDSLFVAEPHRGRGIGRKLFDRAVRWLSSRGALPIVVEVLAENDAARRMYEAAGFRPRTVILQRASEAT